MALKHFILYIIVFLYGIIIGSFLNVCIYRMPKGESVVTVGSHCMSCKHPLKWYDLFPVFSYLALRGNAGTVEQRFQFSIRLSNWQTEFYTFYWLLSVD